MSKKIKVKEITLRTKRTNLEVNDKIMNTENEDMFVVIYIDYIKDKAVLKCTSHSSWTVIDLTVCEDFVIVI